MKHCNRKKKIVPLVFGLLAVAFSACSRQPVKITATNTAMGTVVQYAVYTADTKSGKDAVSQLQGQLEDLEKGILSWRVDGSQVAGLNAQAGKAEGIKVESQLYGYLQEIDRISQESRGALDVTVGKVTALWDLDRWATADTQEQKKFALPKKEGLEQALQNTGYEKILLQDGKIYLPEGISLDLGAVGKGIACDSIADSLQEKPEITGAVISVGGSVVTYGSKSDGSAWKVAIVHPREEGKYLGTLSVEGNCYISTSGDYERFIERDGKRYHHIMDPKTGYPVDNEICSVTIVSDSGLLSDALSTACFVLGAEEGKKLAEALGAEALFVTKNQELVMTDGMKKILEESK